jgi:hypothetical protein
MRLSRMTTRRWMATTAVVAMLTAAAIEVDRSRERHTWYAFALRAFRAYEVYDEEGRATMEECVERSRRLLEAELALDGTKGAQVTAIEAHLARASSLIDEEINRPWGMHDTDYERAPEIAAAKESLVEWRSRLNNLIRTR